jgi:hypothetical protein
MKMSEKTISNEKELLTWAELQCQGAYSAKSKWTIVDGAHTPHLRQSGDGYNRTWINLSKPLYEKMLSAWPTRKNRWSKSYLPLVPASIIKYTLPGKEKALRAKAAEALRVRKIQERNNNVEYYKREAVRALANQEKLVSDAQANGFAVTTLADFAALEPESES